MKRVRFTKPARLELFAQTAHYEVVRKGLGARFRSEVEAAAQRAAAYPEHGKPAAGGTRRRLVSDFPFAVYYSETDYGILVHAVASHKQNPAYWLTRLPK